MMKQYIISLLLLTGLLCSCNDDSNGGVPTGVLYLNIDEDQTLLTKAESEVTNESLRVDIIKASGDTLKSYKDYLTEVKGEKLILPVGKYAVSVSSNHSGEAAWETPFYQGCDTVEVTAGVITAAKVVCKIANTKVKVGYGSGIKDKFLNYEAAVSNSSGTLTYERDEHRAGYFTPEKLNIDLRLVNNAGNEFHLRRVLEEVEPQHVYTFQFHISSEEEDDNDAGADFDITVDKRVDSVFCDIFIKEEELINSGMPKCELGGTSWKDGLYSHKIGDKAPEAGELLFNYSIGSSRKLKSMVIKTTSQDFVTLPSFDLCDPNDADVAHGLGFPMLPNDPSQVGEKYNTYSLDLSSLVTSLHLQDDKPTEHVFTVELMDDIHQITTTSFTIKVRGEVKMGTEQPICWHTFTILKGSGDESCYFEFQKENGDKIEIFNDQIKRDEDGYMYALVMGLETGVSYTYWVTTGEDSANKVEFKLDVPMVVPNLSFDDWFKSDKTWYAKLEGAKTYWDSGNTGANTIGEKNPTSPESDIVAITGTNKKAAKLETKYVVVALASASIFTGTFEGTENTTHGILSFGQGYNSRPTHLTGYYQYIPKVINRIGKGAPSWIKQNETMDMCYIYIALCTKDKYTIRTSVPQLFDPSDKSVIAYGELSEQKEIKGEDEKLNGYVKFDIPIVYRDTITPKSIVIVATASRYGDYFTGGEGSTLYLDELELKYDYDEDFLKDASEPFKNLTPIDITKQ